MNDPRLDDVARRLEQLPEDAWNRPTPPPPPWPAETVPTRRRLVLRPVAAVIAGVALVALGLGGGLLLSRGDDAGSPAAPARVALRPVDGRGLGAAGDVRLVPSAGGQATVSVHGLRPSARGDFYELWLLGGKGQLVSLGSFRVPRSGSANVRVALPVDPGRFRYLDLSREPDDGDPGHSTISILRGPST